MQWYYTENGTQQGPVSGEQMTALIQSGRINSQSLVWREGMANWLPVAQVPELSAHAQSGPPATPQSPYQTPTSAPPQGMHVGADIPNYLWQSIVVTLMCCLPAGVVAIVYATKVDRLRFAGDQAGAQAASQSAKTWCWVSFGVGLAGLVLYFGFVFLAVLSEGRSTGY
ncbi:CD225/dispanin family protein [Sulfuriroseicoccus oceanibius]|uniref:CD225/dispanin family protein n=1 Tax=Sulfuriroseicoccus oceanibius TaxID=2707525 RepID=A0A7T7F226_9BACT|nr:CD225/dispanin family protein [Sulfuriroseicoccus oceanibius]QQL45318.1 CD225/dispanin family protein [Sulfuriroseicoccus oceanibius]